VHCSEAATSARIGRGGYASANASYWDAPPASLALPCPRIASAPQIVVAYGEADWRYSESAPDCGQATGGLGGRGADSIRSNARGTRYAIVVLRLGIRSNRRLVLACVGVCAAHRGEHQSTQRCTPLRPVAPERSNRSSMASKGSTAVTSPQNRDESIGRRRGETPRACWP
jgi:hypothetical protein